MLPYLVSQKIVVSGSFLEHYVYEKPYWVGFPRFRKQYRFRSFQSVKRPQIMLRDDNVRRTRSKIRRLVNSNRDLDRFLTLTFSSLALDLSSTNVLFKNFILRLRRHFFDFKYLCVPEFQRRGAVHYHLLCNLPFVSSNKLNFLWGHGFVFLRKVDNIDNLGAYICKYLGKANFDKRFFKKNKFFYSYNLLRPRVVDNFLDVRYVMDNLPLYNTSFVKKLYSFEVDTDYLGMIYYNQYKAECFIKVVPSIIKSRIEGSILNKKLCKMKNSEFLLEENSFMKKLIQKNQNPALILPPEQPRLMLGKCKIF